MMKPIGGLVALAALGLVAGAACAASPTTVKITVVVVPYYAIACSNDVAISVDFSRPCGTRVDSTSATFTIMTNGAPASLTATVSKTDGLLWGENVMEYSFLWSDGLTPRFLSQPWVVKPSQASGPSTPLHWGVPNGTTTLALKATWTCPGFAPGWELAGDDSNTLTFTVASGE